MRYFYSKELEDLLCTPLQAVFTQKSLKAYFCTPLRAVFTQKSSKAKCGTPLCSIFTQKSLKAFFAPCYALSLLKRAQRAIRASLAPHYVFFLLKDLKSSSVPAEGWRSFALFLYVPTFGKSLKTFISKRCTLKNL